MVEEFLEDIFDCCTARDPHERPDMYHLIRLLQGSHLGDCLRVL